MKPTPIYLDHAAATPLDERVLAAMQPYLSEEFYNPSATYSAALDARKALEAARGKVAHWLGARPSEITFTAGGTEANNLAVHGVLRAYPDSNVVISAIEHDSVRAPAARYDCREVAVTPDGFIALDDLIAKIDDQTVLVSIMYANNEIGTVEPIREVSQIVNSIRRDRAAAGNTRPLYLHTDACQAANYLDLHTARLGVDLMTLNGGKVYGPKQTGALFVKGGLPLQPLIDGGGQEHGLRSGTENVAGAIGLAEALDIAQTMRHEEVKRLQELQQQFLRLIATTLPTAIINGTIRKRLPNNIHLTLAGSDNERLLIQLDEAGIMAAAGSACSASDDEPSHVLRALGLDDTIAQSSLRFTLGRPTTSEAVDTVVAALARLVAP